MHTPIILRLRPTLLCALLAIALPLASRAAAPDPSVCKGKNVLFVTNFREVEEIKKEIPPKPDLVKFDEETQEDDAHIAEHLKEMGFNVTVTDELSSVDLAKGKDLIVVSEFINANEVGTKYTFLPIPIVCWENDLYDDLKMVGRRLGVDYGTVRSASFTAVRLVNPSHPLSAGLPIGTQTVFDKANAMNWGRPGPAASIIATLPGDPEKVGSFAFEKGSTMETEYAAPARRVAFFTWENEFGKLNANGHAQFDAAIIWAVTPPPAPAVLPASVAQGKKLLYVMNSGAFAAFKAEMPPADSSRLERAKAFADNDAKIVEHLKSLGFAVTTTDEHPTSDLTRGQDLVVISDSVRVQDVEDKYKKLAIPVVTWAGELYPAMALTGRKAGVDFGATGSPGGKDGDRFAILYNRQHPLSAGLTDVEQNYYDDNEYVTNWGKPAQGAIMIAATSGYPDHGVIFAYEKGAGMAGDFPAPARRVAFFLSTKDYSHLMPEGLRLFDAAMLWAVSPAGQ